MALKPGFGKWWRMGGAAEGLLAALVIIGLVGAVTYAATRPTVRHTWDLTKRDIYTLQPQTRGVLSGLETDVHFITIMRPESGPLFSGLAEVQQKAADYVNTLLRLYEQEAGGRVTLEILDPHRDSRRVNDLVRALHLQRYNVVLVQGPERTEQIFLDALVTIDRGLEEGGATKPAELRAYHAEREITSALQSVGVTETKKVGFLTGWGGPRMDAFEMFDLGLLAEGARGQGLEPVPIPPEDVAASLADVDVAVLCGPEIDPGDRVAQALIEFVAGGGALLLAIDPTHDAPGLDRLLSEVGLVRELAVLCRSDFPTVGPDRAILTVQRFDAEHPITAPIARQGTFARMYSVGGLARDRSAPSTTSTTPLVTTSSQTFGDRFAPGERSGDWMPTAGEREGARSVAYAVQPAEGGRAVVFGGSAHLTNGFLSTQEGGRANFDLALYALNWLVERESAIEVGERPAFVSRVDLLEDELSTVHLYVLLLMPLGGAILGLLVWFARRR